MLYLPKNIQEGGWGWSAIGLFLSYIFTTVCMLKLLKSMAACNGHSFKDIGVKSYGNTGKILVEAFLVFS